MALIAVAADKGAPGVTTSALVLAAVWPRPVLLAECDPAGGDLTYRLPAADGGHLDPQRGLLSLAVASRRGLGRGDVWEHAQKLRGGLDVLTGVTTAEQGAGLEPLWGSVGAALAGLPQADVIADCGRIGVDGPYYDLLAQAAALVFVTRDTLAEVVRLRERITAATAALRRRDSPGTAISVVVVAEHKRFHAALGEVGEALSRGHIRAAIAGGLAYEPKSADQLRGEWGGKLDKSLLLRSARDVAARLAGSLPALTMAGAGQSAGHRPAQPSRPPLPETGAPSREQPPVPPVPPRSHQPPPGGNGRSPARVPPAQVPPSRETAAQAPAAQVPPSPVQPSQVTAPQAPSSQAPPSPVPAPPVPPVRVPPVQEPGLLLPDTPPPGRWHPASRQAGARDAAEPAKPAAAQPPRASLPAERPQAERPQAERPQAERPQAERPPDQPAPAQPPYAGSHGRPLQGGPPAEPPHSGLPGRPPYVERPPQQQHRDRRPYQPHADRPPREEYRDLRPEQPYPDPRVQPPYAGPPPAGAGDTPREQPRSDAASPQPDAAGPRQYEPDLRPGEPGAGEVRAGEVREVAVPPPAIWPARRPLPSAESPLLPPLPPAPAQPVTMPHRLLRPADRPDLPERSTWGARPAPDGDEPEDENGGPRLRYPSRGAAPPGAGQGTPGGG